MNIATAIGFIKDNLLNENGSFQGPDGTWSYQISGEVGGKVLKGEAKWKWRCVLSTPRGVFIGGGLGKSGALEKAVEKANKKY